MVKKRDSNYELLKIVSMFMIVLTHTITHGKVVSHVGPMSKEIVILLRCLLVIHVNSFILVTGYYQHKGKFRLSKVFSLNNARWFYAACMMILLVSTSLYEAKQPEMLRALSPIPFEGYWFVKLYLYLYILSPLLNKAIHSMDKKFYQKALLVGFALCCLYPFLTRNLGYDNLKGFSLLNFIYVYMVGAYISIFPPKQSIRLKSGKVIKETTILIVVFLVCLLSNYALQNIGGHLNKGGFQGELRKIFTMNTYSYDNPFVFIMAICYMRFFSKIKLQSNIINKISSLTFGVYLIHDNYMFNDVFYNWYHLADQWTAPKNIMILPYILGCALLTFIICLSIEWIRQGLFKAIAHLRISQKCRAGFYQLIATHTK